MFLPRERKTSCLPTYLSEASIHNIAEKLLCLPFPSILLHTPPVKHDLGGASGSKTAWYSHVYCNRSSLERIFERLARRATEAERRRDPAVTQHQIAAHREWEEKLRKGATQMQAPLNHRLASSSCGGAGGPESVAQRNPFHKTCVDLTFCLAKGGVVD